MSGSKPIRFGMKTMLGVFTVAAILFGAIAIWGGTAVVVAILLAIGCFIYWFAEAKMRAVVLYLVLVGVGWLLPPILHNDFGPRRRHQCPNHLKDIAQALRQYHQANGCFPPVYIADKNGRPMHSWRTLILPYIERNDLYALYDFNEPWDGPNNSKLAVHSVGIFQCPQDSNFRSAAHTSYVAVVGPGTVWPGAKTVSINGIKDGVSNTLLLVEVADSGIHWMEPRDLHVSQMAPTINAKKGQGISGKHRGGAVGVLVDGQMKFLSNDMTRDELRALLTIDGGD